MDDPVKAATKGDPLYLDPALREKGRRWFAEAREQTRRDDEDIAAWRRRCGEDGGDGGGGNGGMGWFDGAGGDGGGDGGGGGD